MLLISVRGAQNNVEIEIGEQNSLFYEALRDFLAVRLMMP